MFYIVEDNIRIKKWAGGKACYTVDGKNKDFSLTPDEFNLLKKCDGTTDLIPDNNLYVFEAMRVIRRCEKGEASLRPGQVREYANKLNCIIDWTITDHCNYNCLHCFHAADNGMQRDSFNWEEAVRFVNEAAKCGVSAIRLTGGEPTLYPHFRELLQEMKKLELPFLTLITNGSRFDEDMAAFIKELYPDVQIMLSYDGIGTHDWLRQHEGSEESVKKAIKTAKDFRFNVRINMNVNRRNRGVICDSVKMLSDMGVNRIRIIKTTEAPRWELNAKDDSMTIEEYYDFSAKFAEWYKNSGLTVPVTIWQSLFLKGKDKKYHILPVKTSKCGYNGDASICSAMLRKLSVQANGDIIPCAPLGGLFTLHDIHMGNVKKDGLQKLLTEGALYDCVTHTADQKRTANPKCGNCRHFENCQGGCPALSFMFGGTEDATDEYKCTFFNNGYFKKFEEALDGWNSMIKLTEEEKT